MRRSLNTSLRGALLAAAGTLAACTSSLPDFTQFKPLPSGSSFLPSNSDSYVPPTTAQAFKPVGPGDLVDAQGLCAPTPAAPAAIVPTQGADAKPDAPAAAPPTVAALGNVGLNMTECDVVRAIGQPQSVNIEANRGAERKVVMIFAGNERAGTYQFVAGRLTSLERGPEPPPPPKPEKPAKVKKKPAAAKKTSSKPPAT